MATSEQIQAVLDEANFHVDRSEGFVSMALPDAISAAVVVELQRIADALEIMAAQGRHLGQASPDQRADRYVAIRWHGEPNHRQIARSIRQPGDPHWVEVAPNDDTDQWEWAVYDTPQHIIATGYAISETAAKLQVQRWVASQTIGGTW